MRRKSGKVVALAVVSSLLATMMINANTYATGSEKDETYEYVSDESLITMDEEGNVTVTSYEDIPLLDEEELASIDNVQYEIIVEVDGQESVVNVVDTEEEATTEVEMIQEIIDEKATVEEAVEEIATVTESEELVESLLEPVAEPLELEVDLSETNVDEAIDQTSADGSSSELVFTVTSEAASTKSAASDKAITVTAQAVTQAVTYGVVIFNSSDSIYYTDVNGGVAGTDAGYLTSSSAPDAAYLGTTSGGDIMFMQAGVVGIVDVSDYAAGTVSVIDYDTYVSQGKVTSYYYTSQGKLYHAITTNTTSVASNQLYGYQQDYMSSNTTYYSYDGHYFYTSYKAMITDYKNNTYANAINTDDPYYNYYQYLSHRSTTNFTADQINTYLETKIDSTSQMWKTGSSFIEYQNAYGVNAALMVGVAINESAWGTSNIANDKNNLFGHGASDTNPYYNANGYTTVADSIKYHAEYFISRGYLDVTTDYRYNGSHLGNKQSGVNVKYASDPYWGEKAAAQVWLMEMYFSSSTVDVYTETIGIVNNSASIYESPTGSVLYSLKNKDATTSWEMPVLILEQVTVNGVLWYKIQSDIPVNSTRTGVDYALIYNFDDDYVYIKASDVYVVSGEIPEGSYDDSYMLGDVSGDGTIDALDYIKVKNHITGVTILTGSALVAADTSEDGKIDALDYIKIKNHITGDKLLW